MNSTSNINEEREEEEIIERNNISINDNSTFKTNRYNSFMLSELCDTKKKCLNGVIEIRDKKVQYL